MCACVRARECVRVCATTCVPLAVPFILYTWPSPHGDVTLTRPPAFPVSPIDDRSAMIDAI